MTVPQVAANKYPPVNGWIPRLAEPRAQTNRFDERNGNKYCNSESDFNVARQVFRSWRTKNLRIPLRRFAPKGDDGSLSRGKRKRPKKSVVFFWRALRNSNP